MFPLQTLRQVPQFCSSDCKSAQVLPQAIVPAGQSFMQLPAMQMSVPMHTPVHEPQ
jgi:hypothetical protein